MFMSHSFVVVYGVGAALVVFEGYTHASSPIHLLHGMQSGQTR
jgi:hypothetical protein